VCGGVDEGLDDGRRRALAVKRQGAEREGRRAQREKRVEAGLVESSAQVRAGDFVGSLRARVVRRAIGLDEASRQVRDTPFDVVEREVRCRSESDDRVSPQRGLERLVHLLARRADGDPQLRGIRALEQDGDELPIQGLRLVDVLERHSGARRTRPREIREEEVRHAVRETRRVEARVAFARQRERA